MLVWLFHPACDRHYRVSCNVEPQMKPRDPTTMSHLLNSKTRLMTLTLKHVLRDGKWYHRSLLKPYLFKSNWMYGAPTHSITQKYHQRCFHGLTSTRINGALTRVPYAERDSNLGALLEFWANVHAIGMKTSPKGGWQTIRPGEKLPPLSTTEWVFFFLHWGKTSKSSFFQFLFKLQTNHIACKPEVQHGLDRKKLTHLNSAKRNLWHHVVNPDPSHRLYGLISRCQCSSHHWHPWQGQMRRLCNVISLPSRGKLIFLMLKRSLLASWTGCND